MVSAWIIWLIAAGILLVLELLSGTIVALCMGISALVAVIPAACGLGFAWQAAVFVVALVVSFVFIRPAMKHFGNDKHTREYRTNMDALIGRTGKVTHEITNNFDDKGRVQIDGDSWLAYTTEHPWPIHRGEQVVVESYDSLVLKVRRK